MTLDQTRQLGIEFERRVQAIDPTTEIVGKMDTQDIYSYLNQYQLQYIKSLYAAEDQTQSQTRISDKIQDILKPLIVHQPLTQAIVNNQDTIFDNHCQFWELPENYYSYVRSTSKITKSYKSENNIAYTQNMMLKQEDAHKIIESFYDEGRILRNPVCTFYNDQILETIKDSYTDIASVDLTYIKMPTHFEITGEKQVACDLPFDCFEDLVTGAVELYFNYKYKVSLASQAARRNAARNELGITQPQQQQEANQ